MYQGLSLIHPALAQRSFDGKQMVMGLSRRSGTNGGSQGPSLYVRPLQAPGVAAPGPLLDATPLLWYRFTAFMTWWDAPQMSSDVIHWWPQSKAMAAEFVTGAAGEAVVVQWRMPTINPDDYPCSDPTAYRDGDPLRPQACEVPVCWYGLRACIDDPTEEQIQHQPSFWEETSDGEAMPTDCNLSAPSNEQYLGMHCLSMRPFLLLYDVEDLAAVYRGEQAHNQPQPYASIPLESIWLYDRSKSSGSTYDPSTQRLYIAQGGVGTPVIHVFDLDIGEAGGPAPDAGELDAGGPDAAGGGPDRAQQDLAAPDVTAVQDGAAQDLLQVARDRTQADLMVTQGDQAQVSGQCACRGEAGGPSVAALMILFGLALGSRRRA